MKRFFLLLALFGLALASPVLGQSLPTLPRTTAPGITDSSLYLISDTVAGQTRKTKAVTGALLKAYFTPAVTDSATGAARAQILTTARTLWGQSFNGSAALTGALTGSDGTAAAPQFSFTNSTGTGLYRFGTDTLGIATAGVASLKISGGASTRVTGGAGALTITVGPGASNQMALNTNTSGGVSTRALLLTSTQTLGANDGAANAPTYSFASNSGNGWYRFGADTMGLALGGGAAMDFSAVAGIKMRGAAGNMTIQAGTGNSRTLTLQTTEATGVAKNTLVLGADSSVTALGYFRAFPLGTTGCGGIDSVGMAIKSSRLRNTGICFNLNGTDTTVGIVVNNTRMLEAVKGTGNNYVQALSTAFLVNTGSASVPSLAGIGDANTGLYWFSNQDTLGITTGGALSLGIRGGASSTLFGGAGNMTIQGGTGASRSLTLAGTDGASNPCSFVALTVTKTSLGSGGCAATDSLVFGAAVSSAIILGGAGNMVVQAGTGNNRTLTLQSTGTAGAALNTMIVGVASADSDVAFLGGIRMSSANQSITNTAGTMILTPGGGNAGTLRLDGTGGAAAIINNATQVKFGVQSATRVPTLPAISFSLDTLLGIYNVGTAGANDTLGIAVNGIAQAKFGSAGVLLFPNLPAEGATKNAMCWDATTKNVTQNAAATCTVSARRFKTNIKPMSLAEASHITTLLQPSTYNERIGNTAHIGLIAEEADSVDHRLASRDGSGRITSVNYEEVTIALLKVVQDQQRQLDAQKKMLDSLSKMVDTLFWKRGTLCNGKACKNEPTIDLHFVSRKH